MYGGTGIPTKSISYVIDRYESILKDRGQQLSGYQSEVRYARDEVSLIEKYADTNLAYYSDVEALMTAYSEHCRQKGIANIEQTSKVEFIGWLLDSPSVKLCDCPTHISCAFEKVVNGANTCVNTCADRCPFCKVQKKEKNV